MFLLSCVLLFVCEKPSAEREPLEKTPAGGDAIAQFNLGVNYGTREGLPKDEARAFEWFQKQPPKEAIRPNSLSVKCMRKVQDRNCADLMKSLLRYALLALVLGAASRPALAAKWQYQTAFETGTKQADGKAETGTAFVWLPPASKTLRGLLIGGKIGIELELALDPEIRKACADNDIGIIYFLPHISKLFHYWEEGATDAARLLKTIDGIADVTGHPEIKRVPWITMGHSTGGMFCRNVAYWQPARVGGIIHVRSGNLFQTVHYPPSGSLAGVPFLAVNGQFETHGPRGGNRPELGRETLIYFNREDMQKLQQLDPNHLAALLVEPGGDHFHDSVETSACIALFIRKIAHYRLPGTLPPGADR